MITLFPWRRVWRSQAVWFSLLMLVILGGVAVSAPWLAPHDPYRMNVPHASLPVMWEQNPLRPGLAEYPLGTDRFGRDVVSRLLYGARTAVFLALAAVPLAALIGAVVGLAAGYAGGALDRLLLVTMGMIQSLPGIMFMVIIVLIFRSWLAPSWLNGLITLTVGFAAVGWVGLARLVRVNVLQLKAQLFVEAAIALGASPWRIITRHLLPNVLHVIVVWVINTIPAVILLEAVLGYIGVGVTSAVEGDEFTVVSWGGMFFSGRAALSRNPWMLAVPSLCVLLISISFVLLGDFLLGLSRGESA